jgi:hypothetical protein
LLVREIPTLIYPIVPAIGLWSIVGGSDVGKSMWLRQLAIDIATGKETFMGMELKCRYRKVIYIATEDDTATTSFLVQTQTETPEGLQNIRFHFDPNNIPEYLRSKLEEEPVDLVIIDAWSDVFGENLNDTNLIRQTLNVYRDIANTYRCSIGFLHHVGKNKEEGSPDKNKILSGQGYEAKMRFVAEMKKDSGNEEIRHFCVVKGNYLGKEYKKASIPLFFDDKTFRFSPVNEAAPINISKKNGNKKKSICIEEIPDPVHRKAVKEVFELKTQYQFQEMWNALSNAYSTALGKHVRRDPSQEILKLLLQKNFVKKVGNPNTGHYESNLTE